VGRELEVHDARPLSAPASSPTDPIGWHFGVRTPSHDYGDLRTPLLGAHQLDNLAAAIGTLAMVAREGALQIDRNRIARAVADFQIAGRVEVLQRGPAAVLDVAHTVDSIEALLEALDLHFPGRPLQLVFGCSSDKDAPAMLRLLLPRCVSFTATQAGLSRAAPAEEVAQAARETGLTGACGGVRVVRDPWEAMQDAMSRARLGDVVCSTGSFYTAGEIRAGWLRAHPGSSI
jgi:dihydrofolate synthase/folylpolyglutamate synthase